MGYIKITDMASGRVIVDSRIESEHDNKYISELKAIGERTDLSDRSKVIVSTLVATAVERIQNEQLERDMESLGLLPRGKE